MNEKDKRANRGCQENSEIIEILLSLQGFKNIQFFVTSTLKTILKCPMKTLMNQIIDP